MAFQRLVLRKGGRVTFTGLALGLVALGAIAGTAHSGLVRWHSFWGELALSSAYSVPSEERQATLETCAHQLARVSTLALVPSAELENKLGQVLFALARPGEAEPHLARAAELDPENRSARVFLARVLVQRGAYDEACALLERVHELDASDPGLPVALAELLRSSPAHARAAALAARLRP
jgi:Flp pilus assembly protein TadD